MSTYTLKDKTAIVTGAGSGIGHQLTELLLEAGCSVVMADLKLRPEAQETLSRHSSPSPDSPKAVFHQTDVTNWAQLQSLWDFSLSTFGRVNLVASVAGIYEPPSSSFWNPPGVSAESKDPADAEVGQYQTIAVNYVAPVRLAQMAIDYWTQNKDDDVEGNYFALASLAGIVHSIDKVLYYSSKAGLVSFVRCMGSLRDLCGIRVAALAPGFVHTPIFQQDWSRMVLRESDLALTARETAEMAMRVIQEPQYGKGDIIEINKIGSHANPEISVRDVPMEALYPTFMAELPAGLAEAGERVAARIQEKGMRP